MQCKIAAKARIYYRELVTSAKGRVNSLHSTVETEDKEVEFHSYTYTVGKGKVLIKSCKVELPARLLVIFADSPYISGIDKYRRVQFPKEV